MDHEARLALVRGGAGLPQHLLRFPVRDGVDEHANLHANGESGVVQNVLGRPIHVDDASVVKLPPQHLAGHQPNGADMKKRKHP